ncbi:MAG: DUF2232 domain-containing protein [Clostridia bacterium]|nr:DUF2232 domain-containing protein [Clostridia bacterium]
MKSPRTQSQSARAVTEGALLAALTIVLYVADFYTKLLVYVIPVPIAILVVRRDLRTGAMAAVVAALGVGLILGPIDGLIVLASVGFVGLSLGFCLSKRISWITTIAFTSIAALGMIVMDFLLGAVAARLSPAASLAQMQKLMLEAGAQAQAIYKKMGVAEETLKAGTQLFDMLPKLFETFLPVVAIMIAVTAAGIAYAVTRFVLKRTNHYVDPIPPFQEWRIEWQWAWGLIAGILLGNAGAIWKMPIVATVGQNIMVAFWMLYGVQGVAVLWWSLAKYNVAKGLRVLIALMIYTSPALNPLLPLAGVLDGWFDFRKMAAKRG